MAGDKYAALRAEFIASDCPSVAEFAKLKGLTGRAARNMENRASEQKWLERQRERIDQRVKDREKERERVRIEEEKRWARKLVEGWAQARMNALTNYLSAQATQGKAAKALLTRETPPTAQEARSLMGGALDGIKGYNLATGNPTEITEHTGAVQVAQQWTNEQLTEFARAALGKV